MSKTKEERAANREARKQKRQERQAKINEMIAASKNVPDLSDSDFMSDYESVFGKIWPMLKPALEFAEQMKATGEKTDAVLQELITIGNSMEAGTASAADIDTFQTKLKNIWKFVRMVLSAATVLTNDDTDKVIDKVLGIGDWITGTDESAA